jgi:aryl-phospho-beta-D-glucosidase BglC (GH1 family)
LENQEKRLKVFSFKCLIRLGFPMRAAETSMRSDTSLKLRVTGILAAVLLLVCAASRAEVRFVRADGKYLVAPSGKTLLLRGVNLGNWLEPEGYMFLLDHGATSPREIERLFNELIGPAASDEFWHEYRRQYITKADIDYIQRAGFNSVRIPLHYKFFVSGDEGFQLLDHVIAWCRQAGLWVILDLHCAPAGQTGTNIDDSWGYPWLFESPRDQALTSKVWKRIAMHYRDEPTVLGYDLLNEPIPPFPPLLKYNTALEPLYRQISTVIRKVDKHHVIILEGAQWANNFAIFGPPFAKNVLYEFHMYKTQTTQSSIQEYLNFRDRHEVPIWLGESGENTNAWIHDFVEVLENNEVGWCFWPYKKMEDHSAVATFAKPIYWNEIVAYGESTGVVGESEKRLPVRPSLEHSRKSIRDLLEKIRFQNCKMNAEYLSALGLRVPNQQNATAASAGETRKTVTKPEENILAGREHRANICLVDCR